jgi:hypothetical protein
MSDAALPPGYRGCVAALAVGQILAWAALYYGFSSFVLATMAEPAGASGS